VKMEPSRCSPERVAEVIAEDVVELFLNAEFEASQFPIPATVLVDALPEETLLRIALYLHKNLYRLSIPLGFFLLFLMPRKIPEGQKREVFRGVVEDLQSIRKDFSLRTTVEVRELNHELPDAWEEIGVREYRRTLFLLENLNELRVPVYRGWGFDRFFWEGFLYRAYNLGTLKRPEWVYFRAEVARQPRLNVFGHVKEAEVVRRVSASEGFDLEEIVERLREEQEKAEDLQSAGEKIEFVLSQWEVFLGKRIGRTFVVPARPTSAGIPRKDRCLAERLKAGTKMHILRLLTKGVQ